MTAANGSRAQERVYRMDQFKVPSTAREEFLARVHEIHAFLRTVPGFEGDYLLEQPGDPDTVRIVTIAIWKDDIAVGHARSLVEAEYRRTGFDPKALIERLGIEADLGLYRDLA